MISKLEPGEAGSPMTRPYSDNLRRDAEWFCPGSQSTFADKFARQRLVDKLARLIQPIDRDE
jgi:hypothetical protein